MLSAAMSGSGTWFRLDGKVALVTGGYGGIGDPVCRALVSMGARVAVAGHDADKVAACVRAITDEGGDVFPAVFDAL